MKIMQETQTQLILKQNGYNTIVWGIFSLAVGCGLIIFANQTMLLVKLFGAVFALVGIGMIVTAKFITITVDKSQNQFTFQAVSILGKKQQSLALNQIKEVSLEESITQNLSGNGPRNRLNFTLVFYLQDGEGLPVPIDTTSSSISLNGLPVGGLFSMFGRNKTVIMGNKIASFIGVPFVDRRPPTVGEIVQDVTQEINAKKQMNETLPLQNNLPTNQPSQPQNQ